MEPWALLLIVPLVVAVVVFAWHREKQRRKDLAEWARQHNLTFDAAADDSMDERLPSFSALGQGSNRYAFNVMQGAIDSRAVTAFDYHYETYSTDSKGHRQTNHHRFSAVVINADLPLKPLFIRTENVFDKIGEFIGFDDIDFESAEFSRTFCVKAPDKRWAFDVLHQETMEYLLQAPRFTIEMQDGLVMVWRNRTFAPPQFDEAVALAGGLLDRLPRTVVAELKGLRR
jgi:hypothetical protein